jgi:hypothetical protein
MLHVPCKLDPRGMVDASLRNRLLGFASTCHSDFELENA